MAQRRPPGCAPVDTKELQHYFELAFDAASKITSATLDG
jgi:hypothetical protein